MFDWDSLVEWILETFHTYERGSRITFTMSKGKDFKQVVSCSVTITEDMFSDDELRTCFIEQYVMDEDFSSWLFNQKEAYESRD